MNERAEKSRSGLAFDLVEPSVIIDTGTAQEQEVVTVLEAVVRFRISRERVLAETEE